MTGATPHPKPVFLPRLRSVDPFEVALTIARAMALSQDRARLAVRSAWYPDEPPQVVPFLDADAWLATALGCIPAFSVTVPSLRVLRERALRSMLVVMLARSGNNLSEASRAVGTHRKVVRERLRRAGLYPIPDISGELLTTHVASKAPSAATAYAGATLTGLRVLTPKANPADQTVLEAAARVVERIGRESATRVPPQG
ncbi:MAG: hypothetical protein H6712_24240 [Myxococcales bacterium]|nr:hypothetical protein [Myxococcales bacterium]